MPDSFGRVESHCFGCERAFDGQRAQSLAEKIFTEFAAKQPNKPQVHYLLGYLRQEQGKAAEAIQHFQTAVKLDADYLNAWQKIQSLADDVRSPAKEHDQVVFNILRLDPLRRHAHVSFERVTDLAGLWNAIQKGESRKPAAHTALYPLAASKAAMEKKESEPKTREQQRRERMFEMRMEREWMVGSPAEAIAQTPFVRVAAEMLAGDQLADMEE
jgi:tetratricopeptide (TPR) repeat protein